MMLHKAQISGDGLLSQVGKILSGDGVIEVKSIWFKEDLSVKKNKSYGIGALSSQK